MFRLILLCSATILFSFCANENADSDQINNTTENSAVNAAPSVSAAPVPVKKHYEASHEAPFCKLWVVQFAAEVDNREDYKGLWFDLKKDGTFLSGRYADQSNDGYWSIEKETDILKLQFNKPESVPSNWRVQGSGGGGKILWKGNVTGNPKGSQVVLQEDTVRPVAE